MVLHRERREVSVSNALDRLIIEADVCDLDVRWHRFFRQREAVILRGDRHHSASLVEHRMVDAAVAELELGGASTEGEPEELVVSMGINGLTVESLGGMIEPFGGRVGGGSNRAVYEFPRQGLDAMDVHL